MKKNIFTLLVCLMVCCFGFAQNNIIDNELQKILNQKGNDYIDVNIMLKAQMTTDDFAVLNCKSDSKEVRRELITNELKKFAEKSQRDVMSVIQAEERSNSVIDIKTHWIANFINCKAKRDIIYQLASHPDVALITHNSEMDTEFMLSNEETRGTQAATGTIAQHVTQIKADKVWDLGYTGKGVVVAVLDSGSNLNHTDIKDHLWNENGKYGYNVHSTNSTPSDEGSNGHGTHCAGIVCGDGTSGQKTGIAPDATLMTIKIIGGGRCTAQNLVDGVEKAAELGADVISLSVGRENPDENRALFRQTFTNLLQSNIAAAVACGNDGNSIATIPVPHNVRTPGDCPPPWIHPDQQGNANNNLTSVISVGAVNENNEVSPSSSKGPVTWQNIAGYNDYPYNPGIGLIRPDIAAPGENVYSLNVSNNNGYWGKSGTSQAAPCVAGVMALMLEKNPNLTPADLCRIIETTASNKPATKNNSMGSGVIDALAAVQAVNFNEVIVLNPYAFTKTLNVGSNLNLELTLINNGSGSTNGNTTVTISENDNYTTIITGSKSYSTMASGKTASATFVVSVDALTPDNHVVTFAVTATNGDYSRSFNIDVNVSNEFVAPNVIATANGTDINLTWNATNNATSYNIYRDGAFLANTTETSYTDTGLEYGTIYAYTVTSKRGDLESEHSLITRAQTEDNPDRPSPTNVVANNGTVTWTNGAESKGSNIYRKDVTTSVETSIATNVNGTSYTDNTWNSLADGVYQYGVANTYAANESIYTEGFENTTVTLVENEYTNSNSIWYSYYVWSNQNDYWRFKENSNLGGVTFTPCDGSKSAFFSSSTKGDEKLSYLVSPKFNLTEHNGNTIKLSFYYINPAWGEEDINTLKVMVSTSYNSDWTELWSSGKKDVPDWTDAVVDLSAYTGQQIYIAFVNIAGAGYCTGVDNVNISIEGSSESRIEWSDNVYKNVNVFVQDGLWSDIDNWSAKHLPNETEKAIIDANATVTSGSDITVYSLLINEGKSLTLNDGVKLRVTDDFVNNDADAFIINDGAQVFQNNDDVAATFNMNIVNPGKWSEDNKTGWQFIASPLKNAKIQDFVPTSNSDYDLFKYDGTKELEWVNHKYEPIELTAPQNLMAEATSTSTIRLSWAPVEGATSYNVYYDGNDVPFATTADNIFEITGLTPGTQYCYTVTSATADNESEKPSAVCTKTITLAPQLVANMASHSSIALSWNAVAGAELYHVYKGNEKIASVTSLAHTVTGLDPATTYCFTVTSVGSEFLGIESAKSNEACATTDITIPSAPQNLVADAAPYSATLRWDAVAGAESYKIYLLDEVVGTTTSPEYTITGLTPKGRYVYYVTAVNTKGEESEKTGVEFTTPLPTPEAPQLYARATGPATVELTWNVTDFAETYKVYEGNRLVVEGISSTTYTVYDLEAGEHCFTVIAVNAEGSESVASNQDCATTTAQDPDAPIAENVIIGEDESVIGVLPLASNLAYSISQQIYTRAEIGQTGSIKAVSFKYKSGVTYSCTRAVKVYLKQTTKEVFANTTDWLSMTDADLVYDGNITINGIADEWIRIKLKTPFEYTGDNLAVCVYDYTNRADATITFAADKVSDKKALYYTPLPWNASELNPSNVDKIGYFTDPLTRNQIRFSFVTGNEPAIPAAPSNLIANCSQEMPDIDVYTNAITLTWDADATAETYHIYDEGGNKIGQTGGTTFTIEGLECATRYCYYVSAENETGEGAKAEVCTTTITEVPQNVVARSTDETTINMSWDPVEGATSYKVYLSDLLVGTSTTTSFDITDLTTGNTYCHSVAAVNEGGESKKSVIGCAKAGDIQLEMIPLTFTLRDYWGDGWRQGSKITVSYEGASSIDLTTPPYDPETSAYKETPHTLDIPKGTEVTVTYTRSANEISTGESYNVYQNSFDVKCENGVVLLVTNAEELEGGETFTFVADCTPKAPNAPELVATATGLKTIALSWNEVVTATSYNVYQDGNKVTTVETTSYNVTGLTAGTEYCFTVTAVNAVGESDASEVVCEKTEGGSFIVEIGKGGNAPTSHFPCYDVYNYSFTQQIYTDEELGGKADVISAIAFKKYSTADNVKDRDIDVYILNTNKSTFSSKSDYVPVSDADLVYSGNLTFGSADAEGWITLNLAKNFNYTGGNIIICVNDKTGYYSYPDSKYFLYETNVNRGLASYKDGTPEYTPTSPGTASLLSTKINQIKITFGEGSATPEGPTTFFYDFNDGSLDDFYLIEKDAVNGNYKNHEQNWEVIKEGPDNSNCLVSYSYRSYPSIHDANNYIVTKDKYVISADSKLIFDARNSSSIDPDYLKIEVSADGENFTYLVTATPGMGEWATVEVELGTLLASAGLEYGGYHIALHHEESYHMWVKVDNLRLTDGSAKSSAPAKMTDIKGGFEKASSFGTSSGTELSRFETTFQQGVGYLASYEIDTIATFKGTLNHEDYYVFKLDDYDNNKNVGNFNLLGNPFSFNMDWKKVTATNLVNGYAVVNKDGGYKYFTDGEIKVGDGFLVKVSGEGPALSYNTRSRKTENESSFLNIVSSGKAGNDNVVINLAGEQEGFPKINNFNQDIALVYVTENDIAYGIYNCNSEVQEVSLVFKASRMGEYNLHIEPNGNFDYVTLVDLYNGAETNMLTSSYSFTAIPKENGKRFVLKFAKGEGAAEDKFAFLSGNELIVETEGTVQIIDVMGRMVYSNDVTSDNNRIDVSKFNTAAYIIRLINDNGVKTQKIVVY